MFFHAKLLFTVTCATMHNRTALHRDRHQPAYILKPDGLKPDMVHFLLSILPNTYLWCCSQALIELWRSVPEKNNMPDSSILFRLPDSAMICSCSKIISNSFLLRFFFFKIFFYSFTNQTCYRK